MRRFVLVFVSVLAACSGPEAQLLVDAYEPPPPVLDGCAKTFSLSVDAAYQIVSDGTDMFISARTSDGTMHLLTVPIAGGTATTLLTAADKLALAASGDAVFYQLRVNTSYELHQRIAGVDTVLGSVPANGAIELAANESDLYVSGRENGNTTLWRLPRAGFTGSTPTVASIPEPATGLRLGKTIAAFRGESTWWRVAIPGPSTAAAFDTGGSSCCSFVGDMGFGFSRVMQTQNTQWAIVDQYTPSQRRVWTRAASMESLPGGILTDDTYIYLVDDNGSVMTTDGMQVTHSCASSPRFSSYDATHLFGLWGSTGTIVAVMPKPM